jgi:hypothetical protein
MAWTVSRLGKTPMVTRRRHGAGSCRHDLPEAARSPVLVTNIVLRSLVVD